MIKSSIIASIFIGIICIVLYTSRTYAKPPFDVPPKGGFPACQADLNTCNDGLSTCNTDLGVCGGDLASAQGDLTMCISDLGACDTNLGSCTTDLTACDADLEACEAGGGQMLPGDGFPNPDDVGVSGHGPALSYTINGDGTLTDNNTGLMWELKTGDPDCPGIGAGCNPPNCQSILGFNACPDPHDVNNQYTWSSTHPPGFPLPPGSAGGTSLFDPDGALFTIFLQQLNFGCDADATVACIDDADCSAAGLTPTCGFAGYQDWCIPNVRRLFSILDFTGDMNQPRIDPKFGPTYTGAGNNLYWSATTDSLNLLRALVVTYDAPFDNANVGAADKQGSAVARAVRPCL